jgi:hypothetical protein
LNVSAKKHKPEIVRIESIVLTRANCTLAWKIFSNWNLWPKFSKVYGKRIEWHGAPWESGSRMIIDIIRPVSAKVDRVITVCTPPHCVAWISHVQGYTMEQWVVFDPYTGGGAKVTTWIELTGPALCGEKHDMKALMQSFIDEWFHNFSAECDRAANGY